MDDHVNLQYLISWFMYPGQHQMWWTWYPTINRPFCCWYVDWPSGPFTQRNMDSFVLPVHIASSTDAHKRAVRPAPARTTLARAAPDSDGSRKDTWMNTQFFHSNVEKTRSWVRRLWVISKNPKDRWVKSTLVWAWGGTFTRVQGDPCPFLEFILFVARWLLIIFIHGYSWFILVWNVW